MFCLLLRDSAEIFMILSAVQMAVAGGTAICTAGVGYDGPTGLGSPNGIAAF